MTTAVRPLMCAEMLSDEVIPGRRDGPRRLYDNDDDDYDDDVTNHLPRRMCTTGVLCGVKRVDVGTFGRIYRGTVVIGVGECTSIQNVIIKTVTGESLLNSVTI